MLAKLAIKNFFKRFHTFFICFGIFSLALILTVLIFIGGSQLVLAKQPNNLLSQVLNYFSYSFKINDIKEILNLSILHRVYNDIVSLAGSSSQNVADGLLIVITICVFILFASYKISVLVVGRINYNKQKDQNTKKGFISFIIKILIAAGFTLLITFLTKLWAWSGIFIALIYIVVDSLQLMISLHYIYFSDITLKEMFNGKSYIKIMILYLVFQFIVIAVFGLLAFISPIITLVFGVPFLAYNESNFTYTVVEYFKERKKSI